MSDQATLFPEQTPEPAPTFAPGTLVVDKFGFPSTIQPWIHPIRVEVVEEPTQEIGPWVRKMTEQEYCQRTGMIPVRDESGRGYRLMKDLIQVTPEQAALDERGKIAFFMGLEALATYDRHHGPKFKTYWDGEQWVAHPETPIPSQYTDPDQPHVLVYYWDETYNPTDSAGRIKSSCEQIYVSIRLIRVFLSLHKAFCYLTRKADIHFANYGEGLFYADGSPWTGDDDIKDIEYLTQ